MSVDVDEGEAQHARLLALPRAEQADAMLSIYNGKGDPTAPAAASDWGPLRLAERPRAEPFPMDVLPPILARFCREVSESTRAPVDFVATAMLATAGAAIGQSVNVRLKRGWNETPLLYAAVVGDPGTTKTPALRAAVKPLAMIDERLRVESADARKKWEDKVKESKASKGGEPPGPEPPQLRAVVKDITRESLCIVLKDNPRGVLCAPDELTAWVGSFDQYRSKGTDTQFWLSLYTGDAVAVDRKGGRDGVYVPHPFAAVIGGVQPDLLAGLRSERDDGFLDRIAFAYPDDLPPQRWTDDEVSEEAERGWADVVRRLHSVPMKPSAADAPRRPWVADLDLAAKRRFIEWYDAQGDAMDDPERSDGRRGAMSKARALVGRLALILSRTRLACDPTRPLLDSLGAPPVEDVDMEGAIKLAAYLENHRERAVGRMTRGPAGSEAETVLGWIKRRGKSSFRMADVASDLRRFRHDDGPDALTVALGRLERAGAIRRMPEPDRQGKRGPKPSPLYEVHPDLL